ncbi:MAG TPA: uroporphyrinogen-III synthase [Rhizomicrobium sp.]|nr:uroporphyrinogen-III synthase [Rhizomicrobium sp.]
MRILVTRPEEDAAEISQRLRVLGHQVIAAPLLKIVFYDGPEISLDGVQAILASSANGVRAIARRTPRRDVPLFAVGPQTEAEARAAGFTHVRNAHGDGAALARATAGWVKPEGGALLHAAGAEAPRLLVAELEKSGFTVRREVLYEAQAAARLPEEAAEVLKSGALDAVLHFSARSARTFADCVMREGLATTCEKLIALCISNACAQALSPLHFREIRIAAAPNQQALLELL